MNRANPNRKMLYIRLVLVRLGLIVFDIFAVTAAYFLALLVRFYVNDEFTAWGVKYIPAYIQFAPYYAVCCLCVFGKLGMYSSLWKYAGMHDLNRVVISSLITSAIQIAGTLLFIRRMPLTYYVLGASFQFIMIAISRFSYRMFLIEKKQLARQKAKLNNVMVVGTGEQSRTVIKYLERDMDSMSAPVCAVDLNAEELYGTLAGVPVIGGIVGIGQAVKKYEVDFIILADSVIPAQARREIHDIARELGIGVRAFSEFFWSNPSKIPVKTLLEYAQGPVELLLDGESRVYESPEQAMADLTEKYIAVSIGVKNNMLQVDLVKDLLQPNDTHEEWIQNYQKETGENVSFF